MKIKIFLKNILLTLISSIIFCLANPNFLYVKGFGFLSFFIYLPVLFLVHNTTFKSSWFYGLLYGVISYSLYGFWLNSFHPLGLILACFCYGIFLAVVFEVLKFLDVFFKDFSWILQWLLLCSYEFVKTLGFLGFSYGVSAYCLWQYTSLIQICNVTGIFGLNAFVIFSSAFLYHFISVKIQEFNYKQQETEKKVTDISLYLKKTNINSVFNSLIFVFWILILAGLFVYGRVTITKNKSFEKIKVAAIQNNEDPWEDRSVDNYYKNIKNLMDLTDEVLEIEEDINLVVWPETAVVPSIQYNYYSGKDKNRKLLIDYLLNYINSKSCSFVIGNGHETLENDNTVNYFNSAFFYIPKKNVIPSNPEIYSKIHLVPFTEYFPLKNQFPKFYQLLLNGDTHMWTPGTDYKVFKMGDFCFSTPICFEDTFSDVPRLMCVNGARAFINLSNDSWSESEVCQYQHLAMAVFRSVENKVPTVRATTSGQTCVISENGEIQTMARPFENSYVFFDVDLIPESRPLTVYEKTGDVAGFIESGLFIFLLLMKLFFVIIRKGI